MANFTASVYCRNTNPHDTCEHFEYKSKMDEVEE